MGLFDVSGGVGRSYSRLRRYHKFINDKSHMKGVPTYMRVSTLLELFELFQSGKHDVLARLLNLSSEEYLV